MSSPQDPKSASATQPGRGTLRGAGCVVLAFLLSSCGSVSAGRQDAPRDNESLVIPSASLIFVVHGDGSYRYHDTSGTPHRADREAIAGAVRVAESNPQSEVFVFHQRPRRRTLFVFPRRDGTMYYYRHGKLIATESYRRNQGPSRFDPEVALYRRVRADAPARNVNMFLYFGHEIPEFAVSGYDKSVPSRQFLIDDLATGLREITGDSTKFDLVVLSTCFSGSPRTVAALAPFTRRIVASPDNLHLSYLDLLPLEGMNPGTRDGDVAGLARGVARESFDRLTEHVQTAVSVAVYDTENVLGYLGSVDSMYGATLATFEGRNRELLERYDCAEDSAYALPGIGAGVEVFYRPARFGRSRQKQNHSGWECWRFSK
jgi:hypothetical protein